MNTKATEEVDGYVRLAATVLARSVHDARQGDLSGLLYLETEAAAETLDELGWPEGGAAALARSEEDKVMAAAEKRKHRPRGCGPNKPLLFLVPIPDDPARLRIAGELAWDFPGPEIAASHLATVSRQYKIVVIDDPALMPRKTAMEHLAAILAWSSKLFRKGVQIS